MMARLALVLLAVAALGLWAWLGRNAATAGATAATRGQENVEPGFVANDADLVETGEDGAPLYRLHAQRIEQAKPAANIFLGQPRLTYHPANAAPWTVHAERGVLLTGTERVELYGAVRAEGSDAEQRSLLVRSEQLALNMREQQVTSSADVSIDWGRLRLTARGLRVNMKDGSLRLESRGHGEFLQ